MRYSLLKTMALFVMGSATLGGSISPCLAAEIDTGDNVAISSVETSVLSYSEMSDNRGTFGITTQESEQELAAETSGNTLNVGGNLTNGNISLGDNISGFGSYVMNTGNNSTINSAVSVNVQFAPVSP